MLRRGFNALLSSSNDSLGGVDYVTSPNVNLEGWRIEMGEEKVIEGCGVGGKYRVVRDLICMQCLVGESFRKRGS